MRTILKENMDILHTMSEALMKYETIDKFQIEDLMNRKPVREPKGWDDTPPSSNTDLEVDHWGKKDDSNATVDGATEQG